ncbi:hypothetical protein JKG47_10080 [Acidithiobacillus sp. MC6.1]|nr:hypothetical protein [Acidithiobacillus sp. MC6.1]
MDYRYAARRLSRRISIADHIVAPSVAGFNIVHNQAGNAALAALAWLFVQGLVFVLEAYAGPTP